MTQQGLFELLIKVIVLLTALPVHECAHAMMASRLGDQTARNLGRATLNPLVHLDPFGSILMLFTGFGWAKPVPVMSRNFKNVSVKKGMILVAVAGPLSNLALSLAFMVIYKLIFLVAGGMGLLTASDSIFALGIILETMITLNIGLAVFNLLPVPPLDGSRLLTALLPYRIYYKLMRREQLFMLVLFLLLWSGILSTPLFFLRYYVFRGLDLLTFFMGGTIF
ncbi:site-2 protease family protein [Angelakisella massiliensis]|uniref:site-2 protease family protein n=1 Tax=Angelakisella massiliensis TaxID=1871018 RepID=UPI0024B14D32|nr:site-2 protease family protein [Angelakisella massiliensis]